MKGKKKSREREKIYDVKVRQKTKQRNGQEMWKDKKEDEN